MHFEMWWSVGAKCERVMRQRGLKINTRLKPVKDKGVGCMSQSNKSKLSLLLEQSKARNHWKEDRAFDRVRMMLGGEVSIADLNSFLPQASMIISAEVGSYYLERLR